MKACIFIIAHWVTLASCVKTQGFIVGKNVQNLLNSKQKYTRGLNSLGILRNLLPGCGILQKSETEQKWENTSLLKSLYSGRKKGCKCCKPPRKDEDLGIEPLKGVGEDVERIKIISPPPNLTGDLHIGNLMNLVCTDAFRIHSELSDKKVEVSFSNDHAGQSFQKIFDKRYQGSEGRRKPDDSEELREEKRKLSLEECSRLKEKHLEDLRTLGIEWPYGHFTLDPDVENYTKRVFMKLYENNLISQQDWPTLCNYHRDKVEPISASEVDYKVTKKTLYTLKLSATKDTKGGKDKTKMEEDNKEPLDNISEGGVDILVSTTMPEFYYGTTAIGVSKEDYERVQGRLAYLPKVDKFVPIVPIEKTSEEDNFNQSPGDNWIKGELVIPGHLESDFWLARKNNLEVLNIVNINGKLQNVPFELLGYDLDEAKKATMELFNEQGTVDVKVPVNIFNESTRVITVPILQYVLDSSKLSEEALKVLEEIKVVPENRRAMIENRLKDIRSWCLSRHGWWGVRVPIYYLYNDEKYHRILATSREEAEKKAESQFNLNIKEKYNQGYKLVQEQRILDTWFTSSLWPLIVNKDRREQGTRNILFTCYDILESWIVKMLLVCSNTDRGSLFKEVYLHGMVSDHTGKKMSKSRNNTVNLKQLLGDFSELKLSQFEKEDFQKIEYTREQLYGFKDGLERLIKSNLVRLKLIGICKCSDFTKNYREKDRSLYILSKYYQIFKFYKAIANKFLNKDNSDINETTIQRNGALIKEHNDSVNQNQNQNGSEIETNGTGVENKDVEERGNERDYFERLISSKLDETLLLMDKNIKTFQFSNSVSNLEEYLRTFSDYLVPYMRFTVNSNRIPFDHFNPYFQDLSSVMMPFTPTFVNSLLLNLQFKNILKWPVNSGNLNQCCKGNANDHVCCKAKSKQFNSHSESTNGETASYSADFKEFESLLSEIRRKSLTGVHELEVNISPSLHDNIDHSFISYLIKLTLNKAPNIKYNLMS